MAYANPEEAKAYKREWSKQPEARRRNNETTKKWLAERPEYHKEWGRKNKNRESRVAWRKLYKESGMQREKDYQRLYGISVAIYNEMLASQGGVCGICKGEKIGGRSKHFHVDHDHETGVVRGLLCVSCNVHVGWLERRRHSVENYLQGKK